MTLTRDDFNAGGPAWGYLVEFDDAPDHHDVNFHGTVSTLSPHGTDPSQVTFPTFEVAQAVADAFAQADDLSGREYRVMGGREIVDEYGNGFVYHDVVMHQVKVP